MKKLKIFTQVSSVLSAVAFATAAQAAQPVPVISISQGSGAGTGYTSLSQSSELLMTVQQLQEEVSLLRGQLESQQHQFRKMESEQKERYRDLDRRLSAIMQSQLQPTSEEAVPDSNATAPAAESAAEEPKASQAAETAQSAAPAASAKSDETDQADYQAAFALVRERNFQGAASGFEQFIINYPASPRLPNAYYWLGEIYLAQGNQADSEKAFQRVVTEFKDSRKAADAMYKLGILYKQQGNMEKSMSYMSQVVKQYPETSAARLAESALNQQ